MTNLRTFILIFLWVIGCDDGPSPAAQKDLQDASIAQSRRDALVFSDQADMSPTIDNSQTDGGRVLGRYGDRCVSGSDCESAICVPDGEYGVCSSTCLNGCEPFGENRFALCRSDPSTGRVEFVCFPAVDSLCQPCSNDAQCDGARCLETADGMRCGRYCRSDNDCPGHHSCVEDQCRPKNNSCTCNPETVGLVRVCERVAELGTCRGEETCVLDDGWTGCTAPEAADEICDGIDQNCNGVPDDGLMPEPCQVSNEFGTCEGVSICRGRDGVECFGDAPQEEVCDTLDNDCDGQVDEGFANAQGQYLGLEHCGACNRSCVGRFPFAAEVRCEQSDNQAECAVTRCDEGYQLVDGLGCIPVRDVVCQSCMVDEDCNVASPGSACVTLGDPNDPQLVANVCGRDCREGSAFGSDCEEGYVCRTFREGADAVSQCVPESNTCLCRGNDQGFSIPCTVANPQNPALDCVGRRACENGQFQACVLPNESCDGIDNNCDGVIDEGFVDPMTGLYSLSPQHCGRCNFDCGRLEYANADGVCVVGDNEVGCRMVCRDGFVDLDNGSDDGCECSKTSDEDVPDGIDRNCDGIDGDKQRALFVSKIGADDALGTLEAPLSTIGQALAAAQMSGGAIRDIYVAIGVYSENLTLVDGVNLYGGYSLDFRKRNSAQNPTTIFGQAPIGNQRGTITATNLVRATTVDGFNIYGAEAQVPGASSYAIFLRDCGQNLRLANNQLYGSAGRNGAAGDRGQRGANGGGGQVGRRAVSTDTRTCRNQTVIGGIGGANQCGGVNVSGGDGGTAQCPVTQQSNGVIGCDAFDPLSCRNTCFESPCDPLPPGQGRGENGSGPFEAQGGGPTYARWSDDNLCDRCGNQAGLAHIGFPGDEGRPGQVGTAGQGCGEPSGTINAAGDWITVPGTPGDAGEHGSGGGGGGGGSGLDVVDTAVGFECVDRIGGSGGGGGAGGCAGSGGFGGAGGGGSFVVMIQFSNQPMRGLPVLVENVLARGRGGDGGSGGAGGAGGLGGLGANGGVAVAQEAFCAEPGGRGGNGGQGGSGGGAGGGCGGISVGIYVFGANGLNAEIYRLSNEILPSGQGGRGGLGGASLGLPGSPGRDGLVEDIVQR